MISIFIIALSAGVAVGWSTYRSFARHQGKRAVGIGEWLLSRLPVDPLTRTFTPERRTAAFLARAGHGRRWDAERIRRLKVIGVLLALLLAFLVARSASIGAGIILGVLCVGLAESWPELLLLRLGKHRAERAARDLPSVIDLIHLHVASGMNVETALRKVASEIRGVWGGELGRVIYRMDAGIPFEEALREAERRLAFPAFRRLLASLEQARELGASLTGTLALQARLLRTERRQRAEERGRTAAVKISLPLVLCIFPALLIVYLAPAVLRLARGL